MSVSSQLKALPTLFRVGFAEAVAYRAEMVVWVLATTMPLIMLVLWTAVAEGGAVTGLSGRTWDSGHFVAYYLSVFIVRQLLSAWAAWEINWEVKQGTLAMRLLRPMHPIVSYAAQNVAAMPLRALVTLPVFLVLLLSDAGRELPRTPALWGLTLVALLGGWLISFFANICIGALSFYLESSVKVMDVWLAMFMIFAGYLIPVDLFPAWLRGFIDVLPFRYQVGLPVELLTGARTVETALPALAVQWTWGLGLGVAGFLLWRGGERRFQSFGG